MFQAGFLSKTTAGGKYKLFLLQSLRIIAVLAGELFHPHCGLDRKEAVPWAVLYPHTVMEITCVLGSFVL